MIKSENFLATEQISLSQELVKLGIQDTPLTSLLLSKGSVEKAMSTVYSWQEITLDDTDDITVAEGSETNVFHSSVKRQLQNVCQILRKATSISGTAISMDGGKFPQEISMRLLELKMNLEKTLVNGLKDDGSVTGIRKMSGLIEFADANNAVTVENDAVGAIKQGMKKLWDNNINGGEFYYFTNASVKEALDEAFKDKYSYQHKTTNFGLVVDSVNTAYGTVNVVLSKYIPEGKGVLFNDAFIDLVYLRKPHFVQLATDGDYKKGHVICEATLKVGTPKAVVVTTDTEI